MQSSLIVKTVGVVLNPEEVNSAGKDWESFYVCLVNLNWSSVMMIRIDLLNSKLGDGKGNGKKLPPMLSFYLRVTIQLVPIVNQK
jgi:hypothetical protein